MTLEAWLRPATSDRRLRGAITKAHSGGVDYGLYASDTTGRVAGGFRTAGEPSVRANALPATTWSHLAVTYDGRSLRVYVNGVLMSSKALTGALATRAGELRLGSGFKGVMDDVHVWDTALSGSALRSEAGLARATVSRTSKAKRSKRRRRRR